MLERFTDRARRVVVLASEEARRRGHGAVAPEHLLMGILRDGEGMAVFVLDQLGVSRDALKAEAERTLDAIPAAGGDVQVSEELKRVLEAALAIDAQHCRRRVGTEHLVMALLADEAAPAFAIVRGAGADVDRARRLLGMGRRMLARASDDSVRLIATSKWRVRI
ncbi:MAG TPA: Clp protease N-terminal domain-containing protein [Methylomirabilota bacterium]|nr:Clp protease N-terminal domain-containing protein [Methylomirabilota bacterium]